MIEEQARVVALEAGAVWVETRRRSSKNAFQMIASKNYWQ